MRMPLWETSTGALAALLNARGPLEMADLYTLTLASGAVYRWSGSDVAISGNSQTWALGPGLRRSRVSFTLGVSVDTLTVTVTDNVGTLIGGQPLLPFIAARGLIKARLQLDRAFWAPGDPAPRGALLWFAGQVDDVTRIDRYSAELQVVSELARLTAQVPADVYQAGCLNTLYDTRCGVSRSAFIVSSSASSATDSRRLTFSCGLGQAAGYFDLGVITFTGGANAGISRTVKAWAGGAFSVLNPWPFAVAPGDAFTVYPGCDKTQTGANGCPKFHSAENVRLRYRGQPYIPVPETVL